MGDVPVSFTAPAPSPPGRPSEIRLVGLRHYGAGVVPYRNGFSAQTLSPHPVSGRPNVTVADQRSVNTFGSFTLKWSCRCLPLWSRSIVRWGRVPEHFGEYRGTCKEY